MDRPDPIVPGIVSICASLLLSCTKPGRAQGPYNGAMRILMFTGKGGVGKISLAAATGVKLATLNYRTFVMSIDPALSLADSFDLETDLFHIKISHSNGNKNMSGFISSNR